MSKQQSDKALVEHPEELLSDVEIAGAKEGKCPHCLKAMKQLVPAQNPKKFEFYQDKIDILEDIFGLVEYPLVRQTFEEDVDYVIGEPADDDPLARGRFMVVRDGTNLIRWPILCKLTDIWAD